MSLSACPDDVQLLNFVTGRMSSLDLDRLAKHVDSCTQCQERLERLDAETDVVVDALRRLVARDPHQEQAAVQRLLDAPTVDPFPTQATAIDSIVHMPSEMGSFQILGEIGRGGMGVVYRAFDRRRQQTVALKTIQGMDPGLLYRFKQEFRALAGVTHHNLVNLHELVSDGRTWFFTMELIEGVDFVTHVRNDSPEREKLRQALRQLAHGLTALHQAGKLHRDLKPANVLVTHEGRVVVLDFGLSAQLDRSGKHASSVAMIVGTLPYMSPEQAEGAALNPAADWYSFGVMLYEALTGRLPFNGSATTILLDKQQREPPAPSTLIADVPADLDQLCVDLLRRLPEDRPSGSDILRRLGVPAVNDKPIERRSIFVGRHKEVQSLLDSFDALKKGKTILVHVRGRSGVGKSTLLQRFLDETRRKQAVVLEGRCYEQESVPYKAFDSLIDGLSRYLARLPRGDADSLLPRDVSSLVHVFPVLRQAPALAQAPRREVSGDAREVRRRAFAGLRELLARLGDRRPLVLSIDDLQWGDADSAALLAGLLLPPDPPVLLLVAAYRIEEVTTSPFLQAFLQAEAKSLADLDRRQIDIEALAEGEARELAHHLLIEEVTPNDPLAPGREDIIARESRGNPFFVQELVQYFRAAGLRTVEAALADSALLDEVLWQRILTLPEAARRIVEVVAVASRPVRQDDACLAAEQVADPAILTSLRSGRLLRGTGDEEFIETYHDRVRETVLAHLDPTTRTGHHRRLAEVLEEGKQTEPEALALHWRGAGENDKASHYYVLAGEKAQAALAFDRAAGYLQEALRLRKPSREEEFRLRRLMAEAYSNAGRGAESGREFLNAAELSSGMDALQMRGHAAARFLLSGHSEQGLSVINEVIRTVGLRMPGSTLGALWGIGWRHLWLRLRGLGFVEREASEVSMDVIAKLDTCAAASRGLIQLAPITARYFQSVGLMLALRAGDRMHVAIFIMLEVGHMSMAGGVESKRAKQLWQILDAIDAKLNDPRVHAGSVLTRGLESYLRGEWTTGSTYLEQAEQILRQHCIGEVWDLAFCQVFGLACLIYRGEVARVQQTWPAIMREAVDRGDRQAILELGLIPMTIVRLAEDRPEEAQRAVAEAMTSYQQPGFLPPHYFAVMTRVWIAFYQQDAERAQQIIEACRKDYSRSLMRIMQKLRIDVETLRSAAALGQAVRGVNVSANRKLALRSIALIEREQMPWSNAIALQLRSVLSLIDNDRATAEQLLSRAVEQFEAKGMGLYAASARRRLGQLRGDQQLIDEADAWMRRQKIRNPARMANVFAPGYAPLLS